MLTFASWECQKEDREQEIENLFEKVMTESFPKLVKEIDIEVQKAQSPKQRGPIVRHIIIEMQKVKHKKRILKAREK